MINPIQHALGESIKTLPPLVREHFSLTSGRAVYRGKMNKIWRRGGFAGALAVPLLWLGSLSNTLFAETGEDIPFELENWIKTEPDGHVTMGWYRTFTFGKNVRHFNAVMSFDDHKKVVRDLFGNNGFIEAELHLSVRNGEFVLQSGKQRLKFGTIYLPLPAIFGGFAKVREWQKDECSLAISVTLNNPILGDFFGYEGTFMKVEQD